VTAFAAAGLVPERIASDRPVSPASRRLTVARGTSPLGLVGSRMALDLQAPFHDELSSLAFD